MLNQQGMHITLTWHCRGCVGGLFSVCWAQACQALAVEVVWEGFSLLAGRRLAKPYHFGVNWPTTPCENKNGVHSFALNFECHTRHNKLFLCNTENVDIAWSNKKQFRMGFCVLKKRTETSFFQKINFFLKTGGFFFKLGFSQTWQLLLWIALEQWFSNCGTRTTSGTRRPSRWYAKRPTFCFSSQKIYSQL